MTGVTPRQTSRRRPRRVGGASRGRCYPFEVLVEADDPPFEKDSTIRLDQVRVVSIEKRIHSVVGSLDAEIMNDVGDAVRLSLGLD